MDYHRDVREICKLSTTITQFYDNKFEKGHHQFFFSLELPTWLPDSFEIKQGAERFMVEYTLRAQLVPLRSKDLVTDIRLPNRFINVSIYRGSRKIQIYQPKQKPLPPLEQQNSITLKHGGLLGFGIQKSVINAQITQV